MLIAAACSSTPPRSSVPAPDDWTPPTVQQDPPTNSAEPPERAAPRPEASGDPTAGADPALGLPALESPTDEAAVGRGLIAAAGPTGLRLLAPSGMVVGEVAPDYVVTQPTWSRDGLRLAATLTDPEGEASVVAVVDIATGTVSSHRARRPYFFYSWNHDGTRLAALGPGSAGGTALDILDDSGMPTSESTLQGSSIYLAWEPGGRRLALHAGPQLLLVDDPDSLDYSEIASVGFGFAAAAWVPGTQDILYVDALAPPSEGGSVEDLGDGAISAAVPRLKRRGVDSGQVVDLGPAGGLVAIAAHPDGARVALSFATAAQPAGTEAERADAETASAQTDDAAAGAGTAVSTASGDLAAASQTQIPQWVGSIEILDLSTSQRHTALELPGWWLEWSPDGERLLMATAELPSVGSPNLAWHVWDGERSTELVQFAPSVAFASNYLPFADQYDETPRLWSPDSDAITFGASTADGDITAVARLDTVGAVRSLGPSDVAFWSPLSAAGEPLP